MSDNLTTPASGVILATDEIGGVHFPRTKISLGADGAAADLSSANPMPIGAPPSLPLPAGAATDAKAEAVRALLAAALTINLPIGAATDTKVEAVRALLAGLLKVDTVVTSAATDRSGTITAGGTAQQLMPANASRRGFLIQNLSSADIWFNGQGTAAAQQPSFKIAAGRAYETHPTHSGTGAVSIFGATTAQAFSAREW